MNAPLLPILSDALGGCPLVVAVTGHRDLRHKDVSELGAAFKKILDEVAEQAQGESGHICLSALAEGADTLAARVALANGWRVIAPLPLEVEDYKRDFCGAALAELEDLLGQLEARPGCGHFFLGYAPGCTWENTRADGHWRELQYAFAGQYLTRHCEVLVAFWDGLDAPGLGGTGDVVAMQQFGIPASLFELRLDGALLDAPEVGRAIQIKTPRLRHREDGIAPFPIQIIELPEEPEEARGTANPRREEIRDRLEERRIDWRTFVASAPGASTADKYNQLPPEAAHDSPVLGAIRDSFLRADDLATARQQKVNGRFRWILGTAAAFVLLVGVAGAFGAGQATAASLVLSWVFLAAAWGISHAKATVELQNQRQDYRALAEAWRVCFFWRVAGIPTEIATAYLRYQRGDLDWIRQALNAHDLQARALGEKRQATPEDFQMVYRQWVKGQSEYFRHPSDLKKGKVPGFRKTLTKCRNWSWFLLFAGLCAAAVGTVADLMAQNAFDARTGWSNAWLFARTFFSADRLASPFTPALLLLARMDSWKLVTEENTLAQVAGAAGGGGGAGGADGGEDRRRRLHVLHRWILRRNTIQRALFVGVSVLAVVLASGSMLSPNVAEALRPWLQVVETACFFAPALFFLFADINAIPEHVESYERMASIFSRAQQMLEQMADEKPLTVASWAHEETQRRARRILEELGREALHENGEWLLIHRDRPLDIEA